MGQKDSAELSVSFVKSEKDFNRPVGDAWVIRYMGHFSSMALDENRPESERDHFESNMRICRDLLRARDLLRRIRAWDQLPQTADGPYWAEEIDLQLQGVEYERQS